MYCNPRTVPSPLGLLNLPVDGDFPHERVVLLEFEAVRRVLAVLLRHVTGNTSCVRLPLLRAFKCDKNAVSFAFLSHFITIVLFLKTGFDSK